jgi:hypothetical protein
MVGMVNNFSVSTELMKDFIEYAERCSYLARSLGITHIRG